jgi:hypothetical protein
MRPKSPQESPENQPVVSRFAPLTRSGAAKFFAPDVGIFPVLDGAATAGSARRALVSMKAGSLQRAPQGNRLGGRAALRKF